MNVEKDQAYWEDWDEPALRRIIQRFPIGSYRFLYGANKKSKLLPWPLRGIGHLLRPCGR